MTRIVGVHEYDPKPGVTEAELEQAIRAFVAQPQIGGSASLIKSDRGTRRGKVGLLFEFESVEARDRLVTDDGFTEVLNAFIASHPQWMRAWEHMLSLTVQPTTWSDYQVL